MRFSNVLKEFITDRHYDLDKNVDFYEFTFPNKIVVFVSKIKKWIFKKDLKCGIECGFLRKVEVEWKIIRKSWITLES